MEILSQQTKITTRSSKKIGRGYGSGKGGHTVGRGHKGAKARSKTKLTFDGSKIKKSWIKRTPFLRGKHRQQPTSSSVIVNLSQLEDWFKTNQIVSPQTLSKFIKIGSKSPPKILGRGQIKKALKIKNINLSSSARAKIIQAGGSLLK